jgi:hypothetical protein
MFSPKHFWQTLVRSISEPDYYIWLLGTKLSFSVGFFLTLFALFTLVDITIIRLREVPKFIEFVNFESAQMVERLPQGFTANYAAGKLNFSGIKLPYSFKSPKQAIDGGFSENILTLSSDENSSQNSLATLTRSELIIEGSERVPLSTTHYSLKELFGDGSVSLDKPALEFKRKQAIATLPHAANILAILSIPIWFIGMVVATLITLLLLSLLANSFSWIMGIHMPFIKTFQLGLHAIGAATLVDVIKYLVIPDTDVSLVIPGYLGIMTLVIWRLRSRIVAKL